jgi:hypothetical protein
MTSTARSSEQYTHGRLRTYVAEMKRMRYTGDAFVLLLLVKCSPSSVSKLTGRRGSVSSYEGKTLLSQSENDGLGVQSELAGDGISQKREE